MSHGDLTPVSLSSGSQSSISPQTPDARPGTSKADEFFSPQIANNSPPPPQSTRPGGYGGLDDSNGYGEASFPTSTSKTQAPSLTERLNSMNGTPSPFDPSRRPSAAGRGRSGDANDRPGTAASNISSGPGGSQMPRAPRQNGYGGFAPPSRTPGSANEPPMTPNRSETFPRPSDRFAPPPRTPSAPLPSATLRPDRLQLPMDSPGAPDGRVPATSERPRRPSRGPDTSRPPPPRTGVVRPKTPVVPTINLAEEFGIGNPYHAPSESTSSSNSTSNSDNSSLPERRPSHASQTSQASSRTSPPRSLASRSGRDASDTPSFDNLMTDIQSSMDGMKSKPKPTIAPLKLPTKDMKDRPSPLSARPPRSGERGYDPRIDPAIQNPRFPRGRSPVSPIGSAPLPDGLTVHTPNDALSPSTAGLPSPRWTSSPERIGDRRPSQSQPQRPPQPQQQTQPQLQPPPQLRPQPQPQSQSRPQPQNRQPTRSRSRSRPREPAPPNRGSCKACGLAIKGKSISSADGRLTGRYHKPCFVCSTCREPFSSSTFYVLDDRPYCELHYHSLNGSLCGSCGRGIEGQYLEDEGAVKHHVGCFKCGECGMALRDGYFEVNGKAYCERDAWKLAGGGPSPGGPGGPGGPGPGGFGPRPPMMGLPGGPRMGGGGAYNPSRLGPLGQGPRPRMEKRMTRLGMM